MLNRNVVIIGASAGGLDALQQICGRLPQDLNASVLIVMHTASQSVLPQVLSRSGPLPAVHAQDGQKLEPAHIYVAPPDIHMLVERGYLRLVSGPRENRHRPAIDPTFRSAALAYRNRAIGVILTGMLDDGTSGLMVIRAHAGVAIVQDPETALFSSMPANALERVPDAIVATLEEIPDLLVKLVSEEIAERPRPRPVDALSAFETRMAELDMSEVESEIRAGEPSAFACPECGGVLWEMDQSGLLRFRCRVGHAYTAAHLDADQRQAIETALWSALRALEENASLYRRIAERVSGTTQSSLGGTYEERSAAAESNARTLREFLLRVSTPQSDEISKAS